MNQSEKITPQAWWTLVAVSLGTFMLLLDITIVIVALPDIQKALGAGFDDAQWTVDAYSLSLASLLLLAQTFQGKARGVAFGVWGAVVSSSTAAGPLLGGVLTTGIGWRWIF